MRELEHFIERAVILSDGGKIHLGGLDDSFVPRITDEGLPVTPLADMERGYIERILNATHWRVSGPKRGGVNPRHEADNTDLPHEKTGNRKTFCDGIFEVKVVKTVGRRTEKTVGRGTSAFPSYYTWGQALGRRNIFNLSIKCYVLIMGILFFSVMMMKKEDGS